MQVRTAVLRHMKVAPPYAQSKPISIETIELAPPGPGEVLVRIRAAGLCHSDLSVINGDRPRPMPMALGHEAAGVVEALGDGVSDLEPGDHVVMVFMPSCGHCLPCAEGRPALCEPGAKANAAGTLINGAVRLSSAAGQVHHHLGVSAFAEYAVVSRNSVVKIDRDLPFVEAALFGCAVLTGVGAVVNTAQLRVGATAVVIGLGGVGLAAVLGARAAGASQIIAVDLSPAKLALARDVGATAVVNGGDADAVEQVRQLTAGGADYVFEMAGSIRALDNAMQMTRRGGMTVTAGLPPPGSALPVNVVQLVGEERTLKGSYIGTCVPLRDIPRFIALYRDGRLPVDRLLSGRLKLDDINEGFDRLHDGSAVRQVIEF
ncbi:zinc-dependent alcohol dehydrogenase family protein [Pseudomonas fluorescens]|uniref:Alcohol dehydrogenase n=1 Tax=Pseudomonas aylmerensis TaxID=1869229 RepID=A0A2T4FKU3_9PSED|nr:MULTISPECIES: zinc-dependent alcohol dehydrogenase family protein [Pseudomonas]AYF48042.1 alcohol dehydrogenase [Pseudomonas fluorescens]MBK5476410.1 zinc-dependent alcohol dehydrogenase family protein [Pseudomonas sp. TH21]MBS7844078.1 zinc-dependent alcohol dehydrogenase family protein [Pseudomonas fluorescens]OCW24395.1 alcohol dehydrogenase [Pseudomonas aylmerensis]PTC24052.1 alcohol dehydrogenase [Pseudomonas aylmerensis]